MTISRLNPNLLLFCAFVVIFGLAFSRVHMRVQTTLIGYKLGKLKAQEAALLESRSQLRMKLASFTTKENLVFMANSRDQKKSPTSIAANR